jgi:hypothetical protein
LPVIQTPAGEDAEAAQRPAWQWLLIGAGFVLAVFVPLALLAAPLGVALARRIVAGPPLSAVLAGAPVLAAFLLAAWAAGAVVGRFGLRAKRPTAALSGALGGSVLLGLVLLRGGFGGLAALISVSLVLLGSGAGLAWLGAGFGLRRRPGALHS